MNSVDNDSNIHTGICIVMPASHYGAIPKSHCTVAFLGNTDSRDFTKSQAQHITNKLAMLDLWLPDHRVTVYNKGYEMFGVDKDQPVMLLPEDERIMEVREHAEKLLDDYGIEFSKIWDYKPHVSLFENPHANISGLVETGFQMRVTLRPPVLWWGDDRPSYNERVHSPFHV